MNITQKELSDTKIELTIGVQADLLQDVKNRVLTKLGRDVKVPGFRAGKAPATMVEKALDPAVLQEEVINQVLNDSYRQALEQQGINPVAQPSVEIRKFVPYTELEYKATIERIKINKLADYTKLKAKRTPNIVKKNDVETVLENMRTQLAEKKDVDRPAKETDQVWIDFSGHDDKGAEVKGAKGTNYPLVLGSDTFIPGFEKHLISLKAGEDKEFTITFPKNYGVKALQSKKVTFNVQVTKVQEVVKPDVDEAFVKKVAPSLTTVDELKDDIRKQLEVEASAQAERTYENALVAELVEKSEVALPQVLVDEQVESVMRDLRQNITYRGQTFEDYLDAIGMTADEQREKELVPEAERRLKAGVILTEIAEKEGITLAASELDERVRTLKDRYKTDPQMIKEIDDPKNRREIGAQILTEKTIAKIISLQ